MTTIEILIGAILDERGEIFGIAFFGFGIEIELFSLEQLEKMIQIFRNNTKIMNKIIWQNEFYIRLCI